jgi:hypothetical protein
MAIRYLSGINVDSNTLFVDSSNNRVGIGTASPSQLLHINAASGAVYTRIQNNNNSLYLGLESGGIAQVSSDTSSLKVMANTFTSFETAGSERMRIFATNGVSIGKTTNAFGTSTRGSLEISGSTDSIMALYSGSTLGGYVFHGGTNMQVLNNITGGSLEFYTQGTERARFTSGGNFLIGTTTDTGYRLNVVGEVSFSPNTAGKNTFTFTTNAANDARLLLKSDTTTKVDIQANGTTYFDGGNVAIGNVNTSDVNERLNVTGNGIAVEATDGGIRTLIGTFGGTDSIVGTYTNNNLQIRTNNNSRIFVTNTGDVGVGTTGPSSRLDVRPTTSIAYQGTVPYQSTTAAILSPVLTAASSDTYTSILQLVSVREALVSGRYAHGYLGFTTVDNSNVDGVKDAGRISIKNDDGVGLFSGTSLGFWTNTGGSSSNPATERMRITSGGNVLIGTTTDAGFKLDVSGTARVLTSSGNGLTITTNDVSTLKMTSTGGTKSWGFATTNLAASDFGIYQSTSGGGDPISAGTPRLYFNGTGNVVIGNTTAYGGLTVSDFSANDGNDSISLFYRGTTGNHESLIKFYDFRGQLNASLGNNLGNDGVGTQEARLVFKTSTGGSVTEKMRITGGGNLLIGTTTDAGYKLDVNGSARISSANGLVIDGFNSQTGLRLNYGNASGQISVINIIANGITNGFIGIQMVDSSNGDLWFGGSGNRAMTVYRNGYIGIGASDPNTKLDVLDGTIAVGNSTNVSQTNTLFQGYGYLIGSTRYGLVGLHSTYNNANNRSTLDFYTTGSTGYNQKMSISTEGVVRLNAYGSGGITGTATYNLAVDANGDIIETLSPTLALSLYDLLPAGRVAYNWVGQVVNDTWVDIFSKSDNILTTGTWMVQMFVNDFGVGGGHYTVTYQGTMQWYQDSTNQSGEAAASEIFLQRMGHAANASILYLRTLETTSATGSQLGRLQIKANYSNTSNQTIAFKFVKIF